MKIQDLRIGNYVSHPESKLDKIKEIIFKHDEYAVTFENTHCGYYLYLDSDEIVTGIDLTSEIIELLGFETKKHWDYSTKKYSKDGYDFEFVICYPKGNFKNYRFNFEYGHFEIKYIHELQNLYYMLTGGELSLSGI